MPTISPPTVDMLLAQIFASAVDLAHTIRDGSVNQFWEAVCHHVDWTAHKLITTDIIIELVTYVMEARLEFLNSGQTVQRVLLGETAEYVDKYIGRLTELGFEEFIPKIAVPVESPEEVDVVEEEDYMYREIGDGGSDFEQEPQDVDLGVWAQIAEYHGRYEQEFGEPPAEPAWNELHDEVTYTDDEEGDEEDDEEVDEEVDEEDDEEASEEDDEDDEEPGEEEEGEDAVDEEETESPSKFEGNAAAKRKAEVSTVQCYPIICLRY